MELLAEYMGLEAENMVLVAEHKDLLGKQAE